MTSGARQEAAVIGSCGLALSIAAELACGGAAVTYLDASCDGEVYRALSGDPRLVLEGAVRAECRLDQVGRWSAASAARFLADAEIVAVGLSASGFDEALPLIITSLTDGQHLSIFPAFHGAQKAVGMCETLPSPPDITIAEAASYPTYTVWDGEHTLHVQSVKRSLQLAVSPFERLEGEIAYYRSYFSIFTPAQSFLETSLGNINVVLHPLPILLNLAAVERNAAGFRHFIDGFSPRVGMAAEKLDAERSPGRGTAACT